ncbi:PREDICTED: heavy metal-associated isoprenylated plant protein 36-like [Ipomoea nil]|uniref:heavy metal-associated isoprenylated plant protein 36-like n=1 Tax=Ipomoea nil TaxID=35883 RepID=UPI000901276E|nr:PREDICTED: heavy metal-associated isoprenylated plant protein 36-like [Ipomoea nil]
MAASEPPPDEQPPPQLPPPLPYKTWVLKVSIHCQACKRKVKKVLQSIEGVYITDIDEKQHKVTVTGNVEADALIKKLIRSGKNAEMWHDKSSFKEKKLSGNPNQRPEGAKSDENSDEDDDNEEEEDDGKAGSENVDAQKQKSGGGPSVRFDLPPPGNAAPAGAAPKKKKKKKKKKKSSSAAASAASNNAPPQNAGPETSRMAPPPLHGVDPGSLGHSYPPSYAPQQGYVVSYNAAPVPGGGGGGAPTYYYAPSSPYTYAYTRAEVHSMRCRPLDSFEILSDENPNACYIM